MMSHSRITAALRLHALLIALALNACGLQPILSATFEASAKVVRTWVEACQQGDIDKATEYWSKASPTDGQEMCASLTDLQAATPYSILAIEDRGGLLNSGQLVVVLEREDGLIGEMSVALVNTEPGVKISAAGCGYFGNLCHPPADYFWQSR